MKSNKQKFGRLIPVIIAAVLLIVGIVLTGSTGGHDETIQEAMRDAVLHEHGKISLFGLIDVNPALISAVVVSAFILLAAALIRVFVIPRFKYKPGKFQMLLELMVEFFQNIAKSNSPCHFVFLTAYVFAAGTYIFVGTLFELAGMQWITVQGHSIALPAPLADINGAIALGCLSYLIIVLGGAVNNGFTGVKQALKDFSLPISMSFRLFGALLSGLLVTELVYYYMQLSFVLPVIVGVLFTLLHAVIQTYVLVLMTSMYYGEASEPHEKKVKKKA